ncbi:Ectoine hydroxylase-related dioxygenase, phytanoyl-CoA dioxygenase (PhyH) family [Pricia antarctica]|uniref:Ectoine hydroxylase-related dioxygenase, phytanoyl-CoA dioxygenase (PhyH) family n=1 Tax=Pricia antarctica TaxID=641691 RepID=A0A1G7IHD1_9FLAO|nr:phytanoyl-CoA dioxygenase family protein [Pricia antarctica]SDF11936.1 Ectoine hydroxylase-related dioxygenase, phytanoyl-CoA dioxygenase (PhyH) family [Pricia antarctica]
MITEKQIETYKKDGYLLLKNLFDTEEIGLLKKAALADRELDKRSYGRDDGEGGTVRLSIWNHPGNNIYGTFARSERIVNIAETLLEGEVYHYHSKMILKDAKVGGAWTWHQDYGYWYNFGLLQPLLTSVTIAVDKATKENGCLQVLKGSHKMGRVDHALKGDQAGADMERVEEAKKQFPLVYCEMEPGDTLFFDCNILHRSDQNRSDHSRWSLICCYNAARNDPYKEGQHASYTPLEKVGADAIKKSPGGGFDTDPESNWVSPDTDETIEKMKS